VVFEKAAPRVEGCALAQGGRIACGIAGQRGGQGGGPAPAASDLRPLAALARRSPLRLAISPAGCVELEPWAGGRLAGGLAGLC